MVNDKYVEAGKKAIDLCIARYQALAKQNFFIDVDRAYVLATDEKMDILFSKGEVGTFGKRSEAYRSYLACGVLASDGMEVYFLGEPLKDTLVEVDGVKQISEIPNIEAIDMLFMRGTKGFEFSGSQKFDPESIDVLKGSTLD